MDRLVDDYKVISRTTTKDLENEIKMLLNEGYELYGQLLIQEIRVGVIVYAQALVKYAHSEKKVI